MSFLHRIFCHPLLLFSCPLSLSRFVHLLNCPQFLIHVPPTFDSSVHKITKGQRRDLYTCTLGEMLLLLTMTTSIRLFLIVTLSYFWLPPSPPFSCPLSVSRFVHLLNCPQFLIHVPPSFDDLSVHKITKGRRRDLYTCTLGETLLLCLGRHLPH